MVPWISRCAGIALLVACGPLVRAGNPAKEVRLREVLRLPLDSLAPFIQVGEVTTDAKGHIYATDEYQWAVRKYSPGGKLLATFGRRGKTAGTFAAGPARIACSGETLAVVEMGAARVHLFTTDFRFIGQAQLPGAILDLALARDGSMTVATVQPPGQSDRIIGIYSPDGSPRSFIPLPDLRRDPVLDMTCMTRDANGLIVAAYRFRNAVMILTPEGKLIRSFPLPDLPAESAPDLAAGVFNGMPDELIRDVACDGRGNIFVLAGELAPHPSRDVFVVNYRGNLITSFLLPDKSGLLYLDAKGNLFTRERRRTIIKKYRLEYRNIYMNE